MKIFLSKGLLAAALLACTIPSGSAAREQTDDPMLILTVPLIANDIAVKYHACVDELMEGCQSTFDYCMMTVEEKISYHLQLCLDQKIACYDACGGEQICMEACDAAGTQCTLDAINGNYDAPDADACGKELDDCTEYTEEFCRKTAETP